MEAAVKTLNPERSEAAVINGSQTDFYFMLMCRVKLTQCLNDRTGRS